jgi:hypothetical protein
MASATPGGPSGFPIFTKGGVDMEDPMMFAKGFALDFVYALLAAWLLCRTRASNHSHGQRVASRAIRAIRA